MVPRNTYNLTGLSPKRDCSPKRVINAGLFTGPVKPRGSGRATVTGLDLTRDNIPTSWLDPTQPVRFRKVADPNRGLRS